MKGGGSREQEKDGHPGAPTLWAHPAASGHQEPSGALQAGLCESQSVPDLGLKKNNNYSPQQRPLEWKTFRLSKKSSAAAAAPEEERTLRPARPCSPRPPADTGGHHLHVLKKSTCDSRGQCHLVALPHPLSLPSFFVLTDFFFFLASGFWEGSPSYFLPGVTCTHRCSSRENLHPGRVGTGEWRGWSEGPQAHPGRARGHQGQGEGSV